MLEISILNQRIWEMRIHQGRMDGIQKFQGKGKGGNPPPESPEKRGVREKLLAIKALRHKNFVTEHKKELSGQR